MPPGTLPQRVAVVFCSRHGKNPPTRSHGYHRCIRCETCGQYLDKQPIGRKVVQFRGSRLLPSIGRRIPGRIYAVDFEGVGSGQRYFWGALNGRVLNCNLFAATCRRLQPGDLVTLEARWNFLSSAICGWGKHRGYVDEHFGVDAIPFGFATIVHRSVRFTEIVVTGNP